MKKLNWQILIFFFSLFCILSVGFSLLFSKNIQAEHEEQLQATLMGELANLSSQLNGQSTSADILDAFIPAATTAGNGSADRLTLLDSDGAVLYDSDESVKNGSDFSGRAEITSAIQKEELSIVKRPPLSTEDEWLFIATPLYNSDGERVAVLRIGRSLTQTAASATANYLPIIIFSFIVTGLLAIAFDKLTRSFTKPLADMKKVVDDLSQGQYDVRYRELKQETHPELAEMGDSINQLAKNMTVQMNDMQQNNERLDSLIQNLSVGVMLLDADRNIQLVNPKMMDTLEENIATATNYIQYVKNPWLVQLVEKAFEHHEIQSGKIKLIDSEERILDATVIPINMQLDTNLIILLYDISELTRLERVRTDFVTNASHELKTPVTALKGFTETLLDGAMDDRDILVKFLNIILKETERLDALVGDILKLSKLEDQNMKLTYERFAAVEPILEVKNILKQKANKRHTSVLVSVLKPTSIESDFDALKQIFLNLVNNAILYTPENGKVQITVDHTSENVIFKVQDNGIGMPANEQNRVFERFYRIDKSRSRNAGGTGLGLSIVKHLVENLGGSIQLDSQLGLGSTFTITLPDKSNA